MGTLAVDNFFRTASRIGKMHPRAQPRRHGVTVTRDLAYTDSDIPEHLLDVYRPIAQREPLGVLLYVHGGGFRILSKDTHWLMGLAFARAGYLVFNISYRLAPKHPFPVGLQDCARALKWVAKNAATFGGDIDRLVLAGESAGANLVSALTAMCCYRRPEVWAQQVFELGVVPRAWLPYCGMLQVSDSARFARRRPDLGEFLRDRLAEVSACYLQDVGPEVCLDLADPLVIFERGRAPDRPLPPCFATVGTADPLLDDTRRLKVALDRLGTECVAEYYPGEVHAFHAMVWREQARRCWSDSFDFLARHAPA